MTHCQGGQNSKTTNLPSVLQKPHNIGQPNPGSAIFIGLGWQSTGAGAAHEGRERLVVSQQKDPSPPTQETFTDIVYLSLLTHSSCHILSPVVQRWTRDGGTEGETGPLLSQGSQKSRAEQRDCWAPPQVCLAYLGQLASEVTDFSLHVALLPQGGGERSLFGVEKGLHILQAALGSEQVSFLLGVPERERGSDWSGGKSFPAPSSPTGRQDGLWHQPTRSPWEQGSGAPEYEPDLNPGPGIKRMTPFTHFSKLSVSKPQQAHRSVELHFLGIWRPHLAVLIIA